MENDHEYNLWVLLHQTRDAIFKLREKELREYETTPEQAAILFVVKTLGGGVTPTDISNWLLREHHSISTIARNMEKKGLLRISKGELKGGRVYIHLTEKGEKAYKKSLKRESIKEIMSAISEEEQQYLYSILQKLRDKALQSWSVKGLPFP